MSGNSKPNEHQDCVAVAELLSPYLDGQVTAAEKALVQEHLGRCEGCAQELDSLRFTIGLLQRLPTVEVPRSFTLQPTVQRQSPLFYFLRNATAALAAVLVVLLVGSFYLQSAVPQTGMPWTYGRGAPSAAMQPAQDSTEALGEEPAALKQPPLQQPGVAGLQKLEAEKAAAPEAVLKAEAPAPAEAPAAAAAPAPRAVAPAASPQPAPAPAAEPAPAAPPPIAAAPPVSPERSVPAGKGGETTATNQAQEEAAKRLADQEAASREQREPVVGEQAAPPMEPYGVQAESRWPLLELQIGVGALLVLCAGATLFLWTRRNQL